MLQVFQVIEDYRLLGYDSMHFCICLLAFQRDGLCSSSEQETRHNVKNVEWRTKWEIDVCQRSSDTKVNIYHIIWYHIREDSNFHSHHHENPKSYIRSYYWHDVKTYFSCIGIHMIVHIENVT